MSRFTAPFDNTRTSNWSNHEPLRISLPSIKALRKLKRWAPGWNHWNTKVMFVRCKWWVLINLLVSFSVFLRSVSCDWQHWAKQKSLVPRCHCLRLKHIQFKGTIGCLLSSPFVIDFPCFPHTCLNNPLTLILLRLLNSIFSLMNDFFVSLFLGIKKCRFHF